MLIAFNPTHRVSLNIIATGAVSPVNIVVHVSRPGFDTETLSDVLQREYDAICLSMFNGGEPEQRCFVIKTVAGYLRLNVELMKVISMEVVDVNLSAELMAWGTVQEQVVVRQKAEALAAKVQSIMRANAVPPFGRG